MIRTLEKKTVLVTGATGLIGTHLIDKLIDLRYTKVIALGRTEEKLKRIFAKYCDNSNFLYCVGDISQGLPETMGKVDVIFHAASPIAGGEIRDFPVNVVKANIFGTVNCLEFLKKQKESGGTEGSLVVFSSATVYGNCLGDDRKVGESDTEIASRLEEVSAPYSESKRMIEVLAKAYAHQYKIDILIARIGYVYGYSAHQPDTAFYNLIHQALLGGDLVINGTELARRDNIYVDDVVRGLICVYEKGECCQAYNISSGGEFDGFLAIDEMAQIIADVVNETDNGKEISVKYKTIFTSRKPGIILDNSKLKALGWRLEENSYEGIKHTVKKYREDMNRKREVK